MRGWRALAVAAAVAVASVLIVTALLQFLAPDLAYQLKDRAREGVSGGRNRKFRIALGSRVGSSYRVGTVLNRYLSSKSGYELELVATSSPGNVGALLDPSQRVDLATINSADDDAAKSEGVYGLAALDSQYFFVIVPNDSPVQEFRELTGPINPGVRQPGQPPTLGERVLDYYGLIASESAPDGTAGRATIVRPQRGNVADFEAGRMVAATRTQSLHGDLIEGFFKSDKYRLLPIRDHEALARAIPGTSAGFIPAGLYGPTRRIPAEPVPTVTVTMLLVAGADLPGRVARDILDVIYDPRFARDLQFELTEERGRKVGGLPLHPAADIYYHRNDLVTSDRLGRVSFVASGIAALVAAVQFITRFRRGERLRRRRGLLTSELARLQEIRRRIDATGDPIEAERLLGDADDLLCNAEQDAAAELLDATGIESLRTVHQSCCRTWERRRGRGGEGGATPTSSPLAPPPAHTAALSGAAAAPPGDSITPREAARQSTP